MAKCMLTFGIPYTIKINIARYYIIEHVRNFIFESTDAFIKSTYEAR